MDLQKGIIYVEIEFECTYCWSGNRILNFLKYFENYGFDFKEQKFSFVCHKMVVKGQLFVTLFLP